MDIVQPWQIYSYQTVTSTMDQALVVLQKGIDDPSKRLAIMADTQTIGRGRYQRSWISPVGNLYLSLLFRPTVARELWPQLTFVASLAVFNVLKDLLPIEAASSPSTKTVPISFTEIASAASLAPRLSLKWPNDVLVDQQKIAGILLEVHDDSQGQAWLISGVGVNIASAPSSDRLSYPATYIQKYNPEVKDRVQLCTSFLKQFDQLYQLWQRDGFEAVRLQWLEHAAYLGEDIEISTQKARYSGRFLDLDGVGRILLEMKSGVRLSISSGEVFFAI
jgi:BirA family biotin operon repressor/biotin-[acetyl-CoA-carboxylase] ligase